MNGYWCIFALACLIALAYITRAVLAHRKAEHAASRKHELTRGGEAQ